MKNRFSSLLLIGFSLFILLYPSGCARRSLTALPQHRFPVFEDDLNYQYLGLMLQQNLQYLQKKKDTTLFTLSGRKYPVRRLIDTNLFFQQLISKRPNRRELNRQIRRYFDIYQAGGVSGYNPEKKMLVTGYYQPLFQGSLEKKEPFVYPLYSVPETLAIKRDRKTGQKIVGRLQQGKFVPYWTRGEIESRDLALGNELVYLKDPMDAFTIHIQGSALIQLADGGIRGVHYAIKNGRTYRSIGKYMVDTGRMSLEEASMESIRRYIRRHPEEREKVLHHNDSYIFFHWTETKGAIGSLGRELTPGRSIAADKNCFPPGALGFLQSRAPVVRNDRVVNWTNLHRFVGVQDSGSAIRGPGRVDVFWGAGAAAGMAAGRMKEDGTFFILLLKDGVNK